MKTTHKAFIVGLTGGIACGKTAVSDRFEARGITVIDADKVARLLVQPGSDNIAKIQKHFGSSVIAPDNSLNRRALRQHIFDHPDDRVWLEKLLHPQIREVMHLEATQATSPYVIFAIPLLLETAPNPSIDRILVVDAPYEMQIDRLMKRDNISRDAAEKILLTQVSREERLEKADDIICNKGTMEALDAQIEALHQNYLTYSQG